MNGLGIWSTTLGNSVYWANARFRIAELMTHRDPRGRLRLEQLAADLIAGRAGKLVVEQDQVGVDRAASSSPRSASAAMATR